MKTLSHEMSLQEKLNILADAAKYDVACTSSGSSRRGKKGSLGNTVSAGICHSFASDGRCISLLKILFTNECIFDCKYCLNRSSNDQPRAAFTPEEICTLVTEFYRRNYIEGLFLSSGIIKSPAYTMEQIYQAIYLLRTKYKFNGYIHVKAIPGAPEELITRLGYLADRMSVNIELPTTESLTKLAPHKKPETLVKPLRQIQDGIIGHRLAIGKDSQMERSNSSKYLPHTIFRENPYRRLPFDSDLSAASLPASARRQTSFVPAGQSTQMYQADWLLRFYGFHAEELLSPKQPNFNLLLDPKCDWALRHLEHFPVEINRASYAALLRVPGIGTKSAGRIVKSRRGTTLDFQHLKKIGVVLKRAKYFITCNGKMMHRIPIEEDFITRQLISTDSKKNWEIEHPQTYRQLSLFDDFHFSSEITAEDSRKSILGQL